MDIVEEEGTQPNGEIDAVDEYASEERRPTVAENANGWAIPASRSRRIFEVRSADTFDAAEDGMLETQSQEDFEHFHNDGVKNLKIEEGELEKAHSRFDLQNLDYSLQKTLSEARESLEQKSKSGAEEVFQQALKSLNEVEAKRFVIANVLESLKNGQEIKEILPRYARMGFAPLDPQLQQQHTPIDEKHLLQMTQALVGRKSLWERVTTTIAQIAVNALKTVPKWVEIEPHFGFVGPLPTLGFTIKGKGMSVYELFEALRNAHTAQQQ